MRTVTLPSVSVVVCAYTQARRVLLLEAVQSLRDQSAPPHEIIVAVDHNPALEAFLRDAAPGVLVVPNSGAPGLSDARNSGIRAATGDVVAFLDDDARAEPGWVEHLASAYRDPEVHGAGGPVRPLFESGRPGWLPEEFDWVVGCSYRGQRQDRGGVRNLIGANMSFRRRSLERTDGFGTGLGRRGDNGLGCEETDLCIRLGGSADTTRILFEPGARVGHHVPRERLTLSYFVTRCGAEGRSKAEVARRSGRASGLASERTYTRSVLPAGIRRGVRDFTRGDVVGLARAGAIALGLAATTAGFASGSLRIGGSR